MSGTGEYQRDCWQIVVDPLGYPSIHETDEDGRPGDLVAHCFADRENLIAAAPELLQAAMACWCLLETDRNYADSECKEMARAAIAKATGGAA